MKKVSFPYWIIVPLAILLLSMSSCKDNQRNIIVPLSSDQVRVSLRLDLPHFSPSEVSLRADLDEETENIVVDAIVGVFLQTDLWLMFWSLCLMTLKIRKTWRFTQIRSCSIKGRVMAADMMKSY